MIQKLYSYENLCLLPGNRPSRHETRSKISTEVEFLGRRFASPLMPANMECTISFELAMELSKENVFYILHRFYSYESILCFLENNQSLETLSISVGVNEVDRKFITELSEKNLRVDFITIDIAHGHSLLMRDMISHIRKKLPSTKIIAGNIGNCKAAQDLTYWGADALKVGIAQGKACTTYNVTGVMTPMYSVTEMISLTSPIPIIADGGIRQPGHVCLAMNAGATMVMAGSIFAACVDSPAEFNGSNTAKFYYGSASSHNHRKTNIEGRGLWLDCNYMSYIGLIDKYNDGIRSCISYLDLQDLTELYRHPVYEIA